MIKDLFQPSHIIIVLVLLVILFGWKRLPDAARSVGRSMRIFKSEVSEMKNDGKESSPSPAASDTVRGDVVAPPPAATTVTPPTENRTAPQPAPQAPPVPPVVSDAGTNATAHGSSAASGGASLDATREPERQQNPAL